MVAAGRAACVRSTRGRGFGRWIHGPISRRDGMFHHYYHNEWIGQKRERNTKTTPPPPLKKRRRAYPWQA